MLARLPRASMGHAVALNAPEAHVCLPPATLLESTLVEVFFLNNLNVFKMNTYTGGPHFSQFWCKASPPRINNCKNVSKKTTLNLFRMKTCEKKTRGGEGQG